MSKSVVGLLVGLGLGFLDGASAVFNPDAQSMLTIIIVSATVKGGVTGLATAWLASRVTGTFQKAAIGGGVGLLLSILAAVPAGTYVEVIVPGILIGVIVGVAVAKFGE